MEVLQRDLQRHGRHRVHAHPGPRAEGLDPVADRGHGRHLHHHGRGQARDPRAPDRDRGLRAVPARQVPGHQALRPGRRREHHPGAGDDHPHRGRARRRGDRDRHAASRPAQRAGQRDGQALRRDPVRVPGQGRDRRRAGLGRRQVPSGHLDRPRPARRQAHPPLAHRQPLASRGGQPGGHGQGARQADAEGRHRAHPGHGDPDARRRRLHRPGRRPRMPGDDGSQGLPDRRHDPPHRQQPDRLHHQPGLLAQLALPVGRRPRRAVPGVPRQRRRPGGGDPRGAAGDRVPPEVQDRRGDRPVVLPAPRPQRGRRAGLHPALDVQEDRPAPDGAPDLRPAARGGRACSSRARRRRIYDAFIQQLEAAHEASRSYKANKADWLEGAWSGLRAAPMEYERGKHRGLGRDAARARPEDDRPAGEPERASRGCGG